MEINVTIFDKGVAVNINEITFVSKCLFEMVRTNTVEFDLSEPGLKYDLSANGLDRHVPRILFKGRKGSVKDKSLFHTTYCIFTSKLAILNAGKEWLSILDTALDEELFKRWMRAYTFSKKGMDSSFRLLREERLQTGAASFLSTLKQIYLMKKRSVARRAKMLRKACETYITLLEAWNRR